MNLLDYIEELEATILDLIGDTHDSPRKWDQIFSRFEPLSAQREFEIIQTHKKVLQNYIKRHNL